MRARLLVALVIGGDVEVPRGRLAGASFENIPLCTRLDETGCVVAYRSHEDGVPVSPGRAAPKPGQETACVNPVDPAARGPRVFSGAYFPLNAALHKQLRGVEGVDTPFVALHDFYVGRCADGPDGYRYLAISFAGAPGDVRTSPLDFDAMPLKRSLGLHVVDFQIPQEDLIELVRRAEHARSETER